MIFVVCVCVLTRLSLDSCENQAVVSLQFVVFRKNSVTAPLVKFAVEPVFLEKLFLRDKLEFHEAVLVYSFAAQHSRFGSR